MYTYDTLVPGDDGVSIQDRNRVNVPRQTSSVLANGAWKVGDAYSKAIGVLRGVESFLLSFGLSFYSLPTEHIGSKSIAIRPFIAPLSFPSVPTPGLAPEKCRQRADDMPRCRRYTVKMPTVRGYAEMPIIRRRYAGHIPKFRRYTEDMPKNAEKTPKYRSYTEIR
jgi:hypothetical protein